MKFFEYFAKSEYRNSDKILISSEEFEKSILNKGDYKNKIIYFPQWAEDVFSNKQLLEIPEIPLGSMLCLQEILEKPKILFI